jgi:hypothetical protein
MATPTPLPGDFSPGQVLTAAQMDDLRGAFRILQVIQASYSVVVANNTATFVDTGLSATITPQSTSSRIFVLSNQSMFMDTAVAEMGLRLLRGGSVIVNYLAPTFSNAGAIVGAGVFMELDSPNTTSAVTYKTQFARSTGSGIAYANINTNKSTMTLFEVSA